MTSFVKITSVLIYKAETVCGWRYVMGGVWFARYVICKVFNWEREFLNRWDVIAILAIYFWNFSNKLLWYLSNIFQRNCRLRWHPPEGQAIAIQNNCALIWQIQSINRNSFNWQLNSLSPGIRGLVLEIIFDAEPEVSGMVTVE